MAFFQWENIKTQMREENNNSEYSSSLKKEIFKSNLFYSLIVIAVFGVFLGTTLYMSEMSRARSTLQNTNNAIVFFIEGYFNEITNTVSVLEANSDIKKAMDGDEEDHQKIVDIYRAFAETNEHITYIYSGYENGLMVIDDRDWERPEGFDPTNRPWYEKAMDAQPDMSVGLPYQKIITREWLISTSQAIRSEDIIARWGGDEFGVILPQTPCPTTETICRRIHSLCAAHKTGSFCVSIALGCAAKEDVDQNIEDVYKKAEKKMYENKSSMKT